MNSIGPVEADERQDWTALTPEEKVAQLKDLLATNISTRQIAFRYDNCSGSAVRSFCRKQGIDVNRGWRGPKKPDSDPRRGRARRRWDLTSNRTSPEHLKTPPSIPKLPKPIGPGVPYLEITDDQCRAPQWEDGTPSEDKRYCGHPVAEGKSYCPYHLQIFTTTVPARVEWAPKRVSKMFMGNEWGMK